MKRIGIDGGGTKTKFTLFDEELRELDHLEVGTSHFAQVGYQRMEEVLEEGITTLVKRHSLEQYGIGFGLAGYGQEKEIRARIEEIVERVADAHPYHLVNDVESAIAGALALSDGIMVIAGTGSIAFGIHGENRMRCGGWGYQIGDEGSAYWLGKRLLEVFSKQCDGRLAKSVLYELVMRHCQLAQDFDIISYVRDVLHNNRGEIANLAQLLYQAAEAKDRNALQIYEEGAEQLAQCVLTIQRKLFPQEKEVLVSYVGGVFRAQAYLLEPFQRALTTSCRVIAPMHGPDAGAVLLLDKKGKA